MPPHEGCRRRLRLSDYRSSRVRKDGAEKTLLQAIEKQKARIRAKVEHPSHVVMNLFGYKKACYKGLAKNQAPLFSLFGLANLILTMRCKGLPDRVRAS